ncbi:MAG: CHASE2 domain-containing protein [Leptolyngbyaceae cyanobacterium MO_188.B28]|nr:CHASE2 domain-containing protein [Leptolyngbyaceae cyanobacterium MO_188.B28]
MQLWGKDGQLLLKNEGSLPADLKLATLHTHWRQLYKTYYQNLGMPIRLDILDSVEDGVDNFSWAEFSLICQQLPQQLNAWLRAELFQGIERQLRNRLRPNEDIQIIIETEDLQLRHLPWRLWNFLEDYPQADVALSLPQYERVTPTATATPGEVRILGVLGDCASLDGREIDVQTDKHFIEQLSGADPKFLAEPSIKELNDQLWEQDWDIFFFAGHSSSQPEMETGRLYINQNAEENSLTPGDLERALSHKVKRGLKIAIFNSCDSLGLAFDLARLNIPQTIAMREVVPDEVAQEFLKYFLKALSEGESSHLAVRRGWERLQGLERQFPCASWLPVVCQNPATASPTWQDLMNLPKSRPVAPAPRARWPLPILILAGLVAASGVMGLRSLGLFQSWELAAFDQMLRLRPPEEADDRFLIVTVGEADIQAQEAMGLARKGSLSDAALAQLLQKLEPHSPRVIGMDIYHDFEFEPELGETLQQNSHFIAACEVAQTYDDTVSIAPPPGIPSNRLGFTDWPIDPDRVARRQLLGMASNSICPTSQSLSLRITLEYLAQLGVSPLEKTATGDRKIGGVVLRKLAPNAGGYELSPDNAKGYQILLNYRAANPPQVTLSDVLSGSLDAQLPDLVEHRIVLIGTAGSRDAHLTPFSQVPWPEKTPGVIIHAQMISQILSAVLDQRPLLWWWPQWGEFLWIVGWSFVGVLVMRNLRSPIHIAMAVCLAIGCLSILCWIALLYGGWTPLIPPALSLVATSGGLLILARISPQTELKPGGLWKGDLSWENPTETEYRKQNGV